MKVSQTIRRRLENEIHSAYRRILGLPSGKLTVTAVEFSKVPARWGFDFTVTEGDRYAGKKSKYHMNNLAISCRISPEWIETPELFVTDTNIIAGNRPLDPPPNVDSLTMRYAWACHGNRLALKPSYYLLFQAGTIAHAFDIDPKPSQLIREIVINTAVFRKIIAKRVAQRLTHTHTTAA